MIDFFRKIRYNNKKIDELYLDVVVENPWVRHVHISVIDMTTRNPSDMQRGYRNAARIMNLFDKYMDAPCEALDCNS